MVNAISILERLSIRPATPDDRDELLAMYESFEPRPASLGLPPRVHVDEWLDRLASSPNFLAFADQKLVGHGILCPDGSSAEVAVFIHQNFRSKGIGRRLLETLIGEARSIGMRSVWGMTQLDNVPMLRMARTLGFVQEKDPSVFRMDL
jgi:GNAT superfamily N-acetyltransferase